MKNPSAYISVENEGSHLPEEAVSLIWEQFYKADKGSADGTGLGLAISKEILELHHTAYGVENTITGVRFYFFLPIV